MKKKKLSITEYIPDFWDNFEKYCSKTGAKLEKGPEEIFHIVGYPLELRLMGVQGYLVKMEK